MQIGVLGGTGPAGSGLGLRLADVGYDVVLGSRSKYRAMECADKMLSKWPGRELRLTAGSNSDAAACDVIVIATPWDAAAATALSVEELLRGKVIISMANALARVNNEFQPLVPPRGSVAAHVQSEIPGARVVAAFHHLPARELSALNNPVESDVLICSDHPEATVVTMAIAAQIPGCRPLDAGALSNSMAIEVFTAVMLQLNVRYKTRSALRMTGISTDAVTVGEVAPVVSTATAAPEDHETDAFG